MQGDQESNARLLGQGQQDRQRKGHKYQDKISRTREAGKTLYNSVVGQNNRTGITEQEQQDRIAEQEWQNRSSRTGVAEQEQQNRLSGQEQQNRLAGQNKRSNMSKISGQGYEQQDKRIRTVISMQEKKDKVQDRQIRTRKHVTRTGWKEQST